MATDGLRFAVDADGRLTIQSRGRRVVWLRLLPDGLQVGAAGVPTVVLPWSSLGGVRWVMDGPPRDGWMITNWSAGRSGVFGVAVLVSGHFEVICQPLIDATMTLWRRPDQWFQRGILTGHRLPVLPRGSVFTAANRERSTLTALTQVIAACDEIRGRLAEPERMRALATDLSVGLLSWPSAREGIRRDTTDIITALRQAGFVHRFGRPLTRDELPPLGEVVNATQARLTHNRYREGRSVSDDTVATVARSVFLDVEPWPFSALM